MDPRNGLALLRSPTTSDVNASSPSSRGSLGQLNALSVQRNTPPRPAPARVLRNGPERVTTVPSPRVDHTCVSKHPARRNQHRPPATPPTPAIPILHTNTAIHANETHHADRHVVQGCKLYGTAPSPP